MAWTPVWLPKDGTRGVDIFFARASERYAESFSLEQFVEFTGDFNDDVIESLKEAFSSARSRGHPSLTPGHLLMALLDNPVADHVLRSAGCKVDQLRPRIDALLAALPDGTARGRCTGSEVGMRGRLPGELRERPGPRGNQRRQPVGGDPGREGRCGETRERGGRRRARPRQLRHARHCDGVGRASRIASLGVGAGLGEGRARGVRFGADVAPRIPHDRTPVVERITERAGVGHSPVV